VKIFSEFCELAGFRVKGIRGYTKGPNFVPGTLFGTEDDFKASMSRRLPQQAIVFLKKNPAFRKEEVQIKLKEKLNRLEYSLHDQPFFDKKYFISLLE